MNAKAASSSDDGEAGTARLDKWLWGARFFRTRTVAAEAIELGRVRVNGHKVKPAKALHVGDLVWIRIGSAEREVFVRALDDVRVAAPIALTRYAESEVSVAAREAADARRRIEREPAHARKGRPTKRERRDLESFVESSRDPDGF